MQHPIGYARLSTAEQAAGQALEQQIQRLRAAGAVEVFHDLASGTKDDRPQLALALEALGSGDADTLICTRLDRVTRSASFNAKLCDLFGEPGPPHIQALDDALDTATIGGRMQFRMLGVFAQAEVERIRERTIRGLAHRRDNLKARQGRAPFGFQRLPGAAQLTLDPDEAPIARAVVDRFIALGGDARRTSLWLLEHHGIRIAPRSLRAWLVLPTLTGDSGRSHPRGPKQPNGDPGKRPRGWLRIDPDTHPPLISREKAAAVQAAMAVAKQTGGGAKRSALEVGWFSSRFRCGVCRHRFRRHRTSLHCPNPLCTARYGRGSVALADLRAEVLRGCWWLGGGLSRRLAARRLIEAQGPSEPPDAIRLRNELAALRATGVPGLEAVLREKEEALAAILRGSSAGASAAAEAAAVVAAQAADWNALRALDDAGLLALLRDGAISGWIAGGRLRLLISERFEPMIWLLERDGGDFVIRVDAPEESDEELAALNPVGDGPPWKEEDLPPVKWREWVEDSPVSDAERR